MKQLGNKGFSIIELVVVLLVSSILSLVVLPNYSKVRQLAKEHSLKNQAFNLQVAIESYELEFGSYPNTSDIAALITLLQEKDYINNSPKNPYTKADFSESDPSGKLAYSYDEDTYSYSLDVYNYLNESIILELGE